MKDLKEMPLERMLSEDDIQLLPFPYAIHSTEGNLLKASSSFINLFSQGIENKQEREKHNPSLNAVYHNLLEEILRMESLEEKEVQVGNSYYSVLISRNTELILMLLMDITKKRKMEIQLGNKLQIEQVNASIAYRFQEEKDIQKSLNDTIAEIGFLLGVSHVYLHCVNKESHNLKYSLQWDALDTRSENTAQSIFESFDIDKIIHDHNELITDYRYYLRTDLKEKMDDGRIIKIDYDPSEMIIISFTLSPSEESAVNQQTHSLSAIVQTIRNYMKIHLAEKKLRESEERYRKVVEESLQGLMLLSISPSSIVYSNQAACDILGYSLDELTQMTSTETMNLIHWTDREHFSTDFSKLVKSNQIRTRTETRITRKDGTVIWIELLLTTIEFEGEKFVLAALIDISQKRQSIADLQNSNRDLELYSSLLRHDLKNDLQAIFSNTEAISMLVEESEVVNEFIESTIASVERMLDVLNIFGRPDDMSIKEIAPFLENIAVEAARSYVGMKCSLQIEPDVFLIRVIGGRLLPMVFHNLLRNANKYAGENPTLTIHAERNEDFIDIRLADNGPGISEDIKDRLFEKGVTTEGTGLGLYLSKKVLHAYGGSIECIPPEHKGEGAVFLIRLKISMD